MEAVKGKHKNNRKVTLFRSGNFSDDSQTQAQEFLAQSRKGIGSYFAAHMGKAIGTGFEFGEIDLLMPIVLDIPKDDRTFRAAVTEFFSSICTNVPHGTGIILEIGKALDNDKPVTYFEKDEAGVIHYNLPLVINEYIRYRHAIRHPRVAESKELAKGNMLIEFYVHDPEQVADENVVFTSAKDKAMTIYLQLKEDSKKVDAMLTLMGVDPRMFSGKNASAERLEELRALAELKPTNFAHEHTAKNFEERYTLMTLVNTGICKTIGGRYVDAETGVVLGKDEEEAIYWLMDKLNSDKLTIMKQRMQEELKKAVHNPKKRVQRTTAR